MTKTRDQKRKICAIDTSDRPAKMVTGEKPLSDNCRAPSVGISGDAIPAPVWGRVMEYLYYTDILKCLLVNRMISFEAPKYVKRLVVLKSCEVEHLPLVRNRRRFENVIRVDILCLVVQDPTIAGDTAPNDDNILCTDVIDKIVPFLEVFPKLEYCLLGGLDQRKDLNRYLLTYYAEICSGPRDHASHFRRLVKQFVVAFERSSLPPHLLLNGLFDGFDTKIWGGCRRGAGECSLCSSVLRAFPLNNLLQLHNAWNTSCYSNKEIAKWIRKRKWSRQCLVSASFRFTAQEIIELVRVPVGQSYRKSLEEMGAKHPSHLYYLPIFKASRLLLMLYLGIKMSMRDEIIRKHTTKETFLSSLLSDGDNEGGYALAKSTFDLLLQAEYPFEENDFIVLDDTSDPQLKDLILHDESTFGQTLTAGHDESDDGEG